MYTAFINSSLCRSYLTERDLHPCFSVSLCLSWNIISTRTSAPTGLQHLVSMNLCFLSDHVEDAQLTCCSFAPLSSMCMGGVWNCTENNCTGEAPRFRERTGAQRLKLLETVSSLLLRSRMFRGRRRVRNHVRRQDVPPAGGVSVRAGKEPWQQQIHRHAAVHDLCRGRTHGSAHTNACRVKTDVLSPKC